MTTHQAEQDGCPGRPGHPAAVGGGRDSRPEASAPLGKATREKKGQESLGGGGVVLLSNHIPTPSLSSCKRSGKAWQALERSLLHLRRWIQAPK